MMHKNNAEIDGAPTSWPIHVVPLNDLREHTVDTPCWCHPTLDIDDRWGDEAVFIHHSMDKREEYEQGRQLS